jgi:hypothetical protein
MKRIYLVRYIIGLFILGIVFLFLCLRSLYPGFVPESDLLMMVLGVVFLVLALVLVKKHWSIVIPSRVST